MSMNEQEYDDTDENADSMPLVKADPFALTALERSIVYTNDLHPTENANE